jgi:hypothetical protein
MFHRFYGESDANKSGSGAKSSLSCVELSRVQAKGRCSTGTELGKPE